MPYAVSIVLERGVACRWLVLSIGLADGMLTTVPVLFSTWHSIAATRTARQPSYRRSGLSSSIRCLSRCLHSRESLRMVSPSHPIPFPLSLVAWRDPRSILFTFRLLTTVPVVLRKAIFSRVTGFVMVDNRGRIGTPAGHLLVHEGRRLFRLEVRTSLGRSKIPVKRQRVPPPAVPPRTCTAR